MVQRAAGITLIKGFCLLTAQAPLHDVTQYRGTRRVESCSDVIHLFPCGQVQAGAHADSYALRAGPMVWWLGHS
jgi:hypothetical protein